MFLSKKFKFIALALMLTTLTSCATLVDESKIAYVTQDYAINLPTPNLLPIGESQEALSITYDNKSYSLVVMLQNDGSTLNLIALSDLGIKLFAASFDGTTIELKKYIAINTLPKAQQVLLDIFLSHGTIDNIKTLLPKGLCIQDESLKRSISLQDGSVIYTIDYALNNGQKYPTRLEHKIFNYKIDIKKM